MFLRSLYEARMPQTLHPRADPQASSYWDDDTATAREIARAMAECERENQELESEDDALKKEDGSNVYSASSLLNLRDQFSLLSSRLTPSSCDSLFLDLASVELQELNSGRSSSELSPTGLISVAAADIDSDTASNQSSNIDMEYIRQLRRGDVPASSRSTLRTILARFVRQNKEGEEEGPGNLRFLSLLRRINEIRSQQVEEDDWKGLPYPQIMSLPTFIYEERASDTKAHHTSCSVCFSDYEAGEELKLLPCVHFYHQACIDKWLLEHRKCPICNYVVAVY